MLTNNNWNIFSLKTYYIKSLCHWNFAFSVLFSSSCARWWIQNAVNCPDTLVPLFFMPINSTIITFYWRFSQRFDSDFSSVCNQKIGTCQRCFFPSYANVIPILHVLHHCEFVFARSYQLCIHDSFMRVCARVCVAMCCITFIEYLMWREKIMHNLFQIDQFPNWLLWFAFFHYITASAVLVYWIYVAAAAAELRVSNREWIFTERIAF